MVEVIVPTFFIVSLISLGIALIVATWVMWK